SLTTSLPQSFSATRLEIIFASRSCVRVPEILAVFVPEILDNHKAGQQHAQESGTIRGPARDSLPAPQPGAHAPDLQRSCGSGGEGKLVVSGLPGSAAGRGGGAKEAN